MPTREEMRSLADEIVGSYADRVATLAELRATVKMDLKGFGDSRTAMAKELRADLAKIVNDMKIAGSAQLRELDAAHAAMSKELKSDLAKVRPALAKADGKRQAEAREFMGKLSKAVAEGKAAVKTLLAEFDSTHKAMSREMKVTLARGRQILAKEEKERQGQARQFMGELSRTVTEGKTATRARLKEFADIQSGARDEWQILTATMQAQRVGPAVEVKPQAPVEEVTEEEAAEIIPATADLGNQAFEYLANHPDGTRLVELEQEFGVARIQMARLLKDLIDENKVEKRDLLYFAI